MLNLKARSLVDQIIEYENGNLGLDDTVELFQELVDSGVINSLQGSYGRTAYTLLSNGLIKGSN